MGSIGGAASGAMLGAKLGSFLPGPGNIIGGIAGGLYGLFGGGSSSTSSTPSSGSTDINSLSDTALKNSNSLAATGQDLSTQGQDALHPYLANLLRQIGGDRSAAMDAAAPEINTISDQYDSAFKTANTGIARGGGRNATLANLPQAKDAAIQTALQTNRNAAGAQVGQIGTALTQAGIQAQGVSASTLSNLIAGARQGHQDSINSLEQLGLGLGQIAAMIYGKSSSGSSGSSGDLGSLFSPGPTSIGDGVN